MPQGNKSDGRKMFLIAFVLTLVALAMIMVVTVMAVQPSMPATHGSPDSGYVYRPPASDTLTMVVIGEGRDTPQDFLLIRFNPQHGQVPLTILPSDAIVTLDGTELTLAQAYQRGGGRAVKSALGDRLGIMIDRYAVISADAFIRVAAKTGTVEFDLPRELSYTRDGYTVSLPAGRRRFDGQDIIDLFAAPELKKDPIEKSQILGELTAAVINQNLSAASDERSSGIFKLAINLIKTDLSSADYEPRREAAQFLSQLDAQISGGLPLSGVASEAGFVVSDEYIHLVRQYFQVLG